MVFIAVGMLKHKGVQHPNKLQNLITQKKYEMAQVKLTRQELASREIAKLQTNNFIINYAITQWESELEIINNKQKTEISLLEDTIKGYLKIELNITNRIQFANGYLYIYCLNSDFSHLTLRLDTENKLSINWFSTTCNSENHAMLNYLSILGTIAGNINKIETEFKIWIEEYEIINSLSKDIYTLQRSAKNQISNNLKEIERLQKKTK
jgi:hypothetical protein